ncbi:M16 family metallopeptidase [Parashewanella tropica]|uniref:M16 family metallopeptidase n=1 Tax=Parashewanella tropica TaxID=2547970 RepID=UPI001059AE04|nr:pitrilysin family protein [Parashewanella tropica]
MIKTKISLLAAVLSTSMLALPAWSATKVTEVEGIQEYKLDNGLQVLLFPDPTKETVTVNVTYHVGSKHENYGETGMAHLLEHLVFKGTPKHKDIPAELSSHGARPNGTTWTDRTNYFETFTATEENVNWALSMESDRMVNSFIAKKDLDSEMTVVRNEFERGENSPFRITLQQMMAGAFTWHNYGKSTIGARSDLENVSIDRLKNFYKKYYQPDNATLIVAGKFDPKSMIDKVEDYFGPIPKPTRQLEELYTQDPAQDGERLITVRRVGDVQLLGTMYHVPAGSHKDFAALNVLSEVLGSTPDGRLYKELVKSKKASQAFGFNFQWEEPGVAIFMAELDKSADLDKAQKTMLSTLESIQSHPISDKEVQAAKRSILKDIKLAFNSSEDIALDLSEWIGMGDWRLLFLNRDRMEKVTTADVQRVAEKYLTRNNRTLGRFIPSEKPERVDIPQVANVKDMLKGYKGRAVVSQGEAFDPSQDNIDKRTEVVTLSSGVKVALLHKKTRGESVVLRINGQMGKLGKLQGKNTIGDATGDMLMRGTTKLSREQLKQAFDKLEASVRIGGSSEGTFARVETTKTNLAPTLKLVAEVYQQPAFSQKEFDLYKGQQKVGIEQQLQDPQALAFNAYRRHQSPYTKGHPAYVSTFEEALTELNNLSLKDVKNFYNTFYGADNMQIAVIGDFEKKKVIKQLESLTKDWHSSVAYERVERPYKQLKVDTLTFNTPDKENATFVASLGLAVGMENADAPALTVGNYILGGGFLNSRLATRLRQKDGLSYGAGSFLNLSQLDKRGSLGAYAICAPQNLAKVEIGFKEEVAKVLKSGFTQEELDAAKSGLLQSYRVSRSQDNELVGELAFNVRLGRDMSFDKDFEKAIKSLTLKELNSTFKKHIKLENFTLIQAGDMSKAKL